MRFLPVFVLLLYMAGNIGSAQVHAQSTSVQQVQARQLTSGERVRVQKLERDMNNVRSSINTAGPSAFQDATELEKYTKRFAQFTDAIKKYNDANDPDVQTAQQAYLALRKALSTEFARAQQQSATLGDVQGTLRSLEEKLFATRAPAALALPISEATAAAWVQAAVTAKQNAEQSITELAKITQEASLEKNNPGTVAQGSPYDRQDIDRLNRFANDTLRKTDESRDTTIGTIKAQLDAMEHELDYFRKLDPENPSDRANAFLKDGASEQIHERLNSKLSIATSAAYFMGAFGQPPSTRVQSYIDEITGLKSTYDANLELALGAYRLPEAKNNDAGLLSIATRIVEKERYQFGIHGPIVLTSAGIVEREREESEEKFSDLDVSLSGDITLTGTKTTWTYKWQEFKFATPIKDDSGTWHVWWITARNYSSGGSRTPIGEWVAGESSQGSMIRQENF
jgi:outer membrane murein-binding lipoprotein Lpp